MTNVNAAPADGGSSSARAAQKPSSTAETMSELLRRHPNIADQDRLNLIEFLKTGHPDDLVKATYGAGLEARVIAFKKDHPEHFRVNLLPWLGLAVAVLILLYFAVASG